MAKEISNNEISEKGGSNVSGMVQSSSSLQDTISYFYGPFTPVFYNFMITFLSDLLGCLFPTNNTLLSHWVYSYALSSKLTSGSSPRQANLRRFLSKISKYEYSANMLNSYIWKGRLWRNATQTIKHTVSIKRYLDLHEKNPKNQSSSAKH